MLKVLYGIKNVKITEIIKKMSEKGKEVYVIDIYRDPIERKMSEYFEKIGIAQGKAEVDKKTGEFKFTPGGNRWYVSHLDKSVTTKQLFTQEIFTQEVLEKMAPIVNDYFRFKSLDEIEEVEKQFNEIIESDEDDNGFSDDLSADDLFN